MSSQLSSSTLKPRQHPARTSTRQQPRPTHALCSHLYGSCHLNRQTIQLPAHGTAQSRRCLDACVLRISIPQICRQSAEKTSGLGPCSLLGMLLFLQGGQPLQPGRKVGMSSRGDARGPRRGAGGPGGAQARLDEGWMRGALPLRPAHSRQRRWSGQS